MSRTAGTSYNIKGIQLKPEECMMPYDVKALFISVLIQSAIHIIKKHLEEDRELQLSMSMAVNHITCLLKFCLKNTYFTFQGRHYEQMEGTTMSSPISPIVANLHIEVFEVKAINTSPHTPSLWKRYVDDTFTVIKSVHRRSFLDHINSIDQNIQFSSEDSGTDGSMSFLDILMIPKEEGSHSTSV